MAQNNIQYEISQSLTGSQFSPKDTIEFSFQAMTSNTRHKFYAGQKVDIFYSASAGDGSYTRLASSDALTVPKSFSLGTAYNRKNFVFSVPETSEGIKIVITGSVGVNQGVSSPDPAANFSKPQLNIDYDDFKFTVEKPKVEFTEEGMLVYASPSQFIRATTDGLEIKGGDLELNKITTDELEIFGDVTVFGDLQASAIPAESDNATIRPVSTSNAAGASTAYARADHVHQLSSSMLNDIASDMLFTEVSASTISASNIEVTEQLAVPQLIAGVISASTIELTGSNTFGDGISDKHEFTGSVFISDNLTVDDNVNIGGHITASGNVSASGNISTTGNLDVDGNTLLGDTTSDTHTFIGNITASGDISASGTIFASAFSSPDGDGDIDLSNSLDVSGNITASGHISSSGTGVNYFGGSIQLDGSGINITNDSSTELNFNGTNNTNITTAGNLFIKAGSSKKLYLGANATDQQVTLDTNGNFGIGTTSPDEKLEVVGNLIASSSEFRGDITASGNISASGNLYASKYYLHPTKETYIGSADVGDDVVLEAVDDIRIRPTDDVLIYGNDDSIYVHFDGANKRVGIGTSVPEVLLHLEETGSSNTQLRIESTGSGGNENTAGIRLFAHNDYTQEAYFLMGDTGLQIGTTDNEDISFQTKNGDESLRLTHASGQPNNIYFHGYANSDTTMFISQSGNIGIGKHHWHNNPPTKTLTVQGDISASGFLQTNSHITASGDISSSGTITGNAINVNGTDVLIAGGVDISDDTNLVGGTGITLTGDTLSTTDSEIVHDNLSGFVANEHIDHSGVEITAGAGLTGGGDITSTRDIAVGAGTGVTVNANDVAIGQDVATTANVQFNNITSSGDISASGGLSGNDLILHNDGGVSVEIQSSTGDSFIRFQDGGTNKFSIGFDNGDDTFAISTGSGLNNNQAVTIDADGKIGIGTTSPAQTLDVSGKIITDDSVMTPKIQAAGSSGLGLVDDSGTLGQGIHIKDGGNVGIGTDSPAFKLDVVGDGAFKESVGTASFASGFSGYGWRINNEGEAGATGSEGWGLTIDNLTIRNQMKVYELLINQIRASNGSIWVSNTGKVDSVVVGTDPEFELFFDTGSGTYGHTFQVGDLIRAQRYSGGSLYKSDLIVTNVSNTGSLTAETTGSTTPPSGGFDYVRIGNRFSSVSRSRQGSIYMTADDDNAPYIDVIDGVISHSDFNTSTNIKARLGKLDGINDSDYGDLSVSGNNYGLYSDNVYLKGGIRASFGAIGGFGITSNAISASDNSFILSSSEMSMKLGSSADAMTFTNGAGIFLSGSGDFRVGHPTDSNIGQIKFTAGTGLEVTSSFISLVGDGVSIDTSNFELDSDGLDISATQNSMSLGEGKIILSGSTVPVIKIDGGEISASNFFVSSDGEMTASAGLIGGFTITTSSLTTTGVEINKSGAEYFISSSNFQAKHSGQITGSLVKFKGGTIANWTITSNTLSAGNVTLSSSGIINVGDLTGVGDINDVRTGFRVNNNGEVLIKQGGANSNYIRLDNNVLDINTGTATLSGSSVEILTPSFFFGSETNNISSSNDGLTITTGEATLSGSSVDISTPNFFLGSDTSFISGSSDGLVMSSSEFRLDSTNLDIDSVAQEIRLGSTMTLQGGSEPFIDVNNKIRIDTNGTLHKINSVGKDTFTDTDAGFFLAVDSTTPQLNVGNSTSAIKFDGTNIELTASKVDISGSDIKIVTENLTATGSNVEIVSPSFLLGDLGTSFISSSNSDIEISASSFHVKEGNLTASNVDLSGKLTSDEGTIGGWTITSESIETTDGTARQLKFHQISSSVLVTGITTNPIEGLGTGLMIGALGQTFQDGFTTKTGLSVVFKQAGQPDKALLRIDEATQSLASWNFNDTQIFNGNVSLDSALQSLVIKDSIDRRVVTVGDQPLSAVTASAENLFINSGFEDGVSGYFTSSTHTTGDTLHTHQSHGDTRTISVDVSTSDPNAGSKHYRISVGGSVGGGS